MMIITTIIMIIRISIYKYKSVIVHIELFAETLKILNHRILMMEYCLTGKAYVQ